MSETLQTALLASTFMLLGGLVATVAWFAQSWCGLRKKHRLHVRAYALNKKEAIYTKLTCDITEAIRSIQKMAEIGVTHEAMKDFYTQLEKSFGLYKNADGLTYLYVPTQVIDGVCDFVNAIQLSSSSVVLSSVLDEVRGKAYAVVEIMRKDLGIADF